MKMAKRASDGQCDQQILFKFKCFENPSLCRYAFFRSQRCPKDNHMRRKRIKSSTPRRLNEESTSWAKNAASNRIRIMKIQITSDIIIPINIVFKLLMRIHISLVFLLLFGLIRCFFLQQRFLGIAMVEGECEYSLGIVRQFCAAQYLCESNLIGYCYDWCLWQHNAAENTVCPKLSHFD